MWKRCGKSCTPRRKNGNRPAIAERLQKFLARAGIASRRKAEELILAGRVSVNGKAARELGVKVVPGDVVLFDGQPVAPKALEYVLLNKPAGFLSAASDSRGRRTVVDLVPGTARLFPVGRLDYDTTGLILLTNDGELANRLMHPRFEVDKVYWAEVKGVPTDSELAQLRAGISLEDGLSWPARVKVIKIKRDGAEIEIAIHEGRNRQVRRMFEAVRHPVLKLHRKKYAMLTGEGLAAGESRALTEEEIKALKNLVSPGGTPGKKIGGKRGRPGVENRGSRNSKKGRRR